MKGIKYVNRIDSVIRFFYREVKKKRSERAFLQKSDIYMDGLETCVESKGVFLYFY